MRAHLKFGLIVLAGLPACGSAARPGEPSSRIESERTSAVAAADTTGGASAATCALSSPSSPIHHIIYIQFDNVHFRRDNPNVPSDLEQMPNLLQFLTQNGTLSDNHHTPLKSHTADDIITSLTGVYPSRHGMPVSNSFGFFSAPGTSTAIDGFASSFQYWTDKISTAANPTDPSFFMVTPDGQNAPAPWVAYTRAGCNVGAVSIANIELENVGGDVSAAFASNPTLAAQLAAEVRSNRAQAIADLEGIAIHCAANDPLCASATGSVADLLPEEPGGYDGFDALFGHRFVAPVVSPTGPLVDLDGTVVTDGNGHVGFPGFGGISASQSLAYVASMQEHGVPITFSYISDAHDDHSGTFKRAFGPGEAGYVAQLRAYDSAFGKFFARLTADGITKDNTLFVITADENDHFAGGPPSPAGCDGVNVPCTYVKLGEIDTNLTALLDAADPALASTPFDITFDMVPVFYVKGNPAVGSPIAREYERAAAGLTAVSPITGNTDKLTEFLADPVEMKMLHMITGDPQRTPTFVMFGDPDYFFQTSGTPTLNESDAFAWNHGGTNTEIVTTWLGMVGPGVLAKGVDEATWSDHTDIRPTMLLLAGLTDDYAHDGRALVEDLDSSALPAALQHGASRALFPLLASVYKQIDAPVAELGMTTLAASTKALAGDDATYASIEGVIASLTAERDAVAADIAAALDGAEFQGQPLDPASVGRLIGRAERVLAKGRQLPH